MLQVYNFCSQIGRAGRHSTVTYIVHSSCHSNPAAFIPEKSALKTTTDPTAPRKPMGRAR